MQGLECWVRDSRVHGAGYEATRIKTCFHFLGLVLYEMGEMVLYEMGGMVLYEMGGIGFFMTWFCMRWARFVF